MERWNKNNIKSKSIDQANDLINYLFKIEDVMQIASRLEIKEGNNIFVQ